MNASLTASAATKAGIASDHADHDLFLEVVIVNGRRAKTSRQFFTFLQSLCLLSREIGFFVQILLIHIPSLIGQGTLPIPKFQQFLGNENRYRLRRTALLVCLPSKSDATAEAARPVPYSRLPCPCPLRERELANHTRSVRAAAAPTPHRTAATTTTLPQSTFSFITRGI